MSCRAESFEYVGFWTRVLATVLDGAICTSVNVSIWFLFDYHRWAVEHRSMMPDLASALFWLSFFIWFVMRFGGTPGKLIVGIRIVDTRGRFLNLNRAMRRELVPNIVMSVAYLMQTYRALATYPESAPRGTFVEIGTLLTDYGQPFSSIATAMSFLIFIDIGAILFTQNRQAVHDLIAGSYVITKSSYANLSESTPETVMVAAGKPAECAE